MNRTRTTIQLLAIAALSILVSVIVFAYINGLKSNLKSQYATRPLILVTKQIPAGTSFNTAVSQGAVTNVQFPLSEYPEGALDSLEGVSGELVARYTLQPGQVLLRESFGVDAVRTGTLLIPDGLLAISVNVPEYARAGSFLQPGAKVAIFASSAASSKSDAVTQILFSGIQVLAVGNNIDPTATSSSESALVTLAVSPTQAKKLVHAAQNFSLYFGILGPKVQLDLTESIRNSNLFQNS